MKTGLDQYTDILKDAVKDSAAKLTKSFEKILIEVIILYLIIPRKINFTQMERYGSHDEQTYRNNFGRKKSKSINWLKLNATLAQGFFDKRENWAIAIDPSYISKAGKKTPHIGRFWSGCAQSVKHGLEIMGIGLIDTDANDCIMLRAEQTPNTKELNLRSKSLVEHYIFVIKRYKKELLKLSNLIVADAYFSTSTFANGIKEQGFFNELLIHGHYNYGIMGLSLRPGNACVVSTYRVKRKEDLWKVTAHEFFHACGLPHCPKDNPRCLMQDAHGKDTFYRKGKLCKDCEKAIRKIFFGDDGGNC